MSRLMPSLRGDAELVLAALLWGGTFVVLHDVVAGIPPATLVCLRFAAATLLLAPLAWRRAGAAAFRGPALAGGVAAGLLGALGYAFQAEGLRRVSPGTSAFLTGLGSLVAGLFAWPLLGQRPGRALTLGIAVAAAGVALMTGPRVTRPGSGEAWTVLGAAAFGLQVVALARWAPAAPPLALAAVQAATLALATAPFGAAGFASLTLAPATWARLGYLIVAGSVVAPLLQIRGQRSVPAGRTGLLLALEPVFATAIAVAVAAERPAAAWWAGAMLILLAVWTVERDAARRAAAPPRRASARTPA